LSRAHRGACVREPSQRLDLCEKDPAHLGRRRDLERRGAAGREFGGAGLLECLGELFRPARALRPGEGEEPVDVRVLEAERKAARFARVAGPRLAGGLAGEELSEPEAQALLADPGGAVQEGRAGERARARRCDQRTARRCVADQRAEHAHVPHLARSQSRGSTGSGTFPAPGARTWNSICGPAGAPSPPTVPSTWRAATTCPSRTRTSPR